MENKSKFIADKHLKELFELGTTYSDKIEVFPDVKVVFRLLTMEESVEVAEAVTRYVGMESRALYSQLQTLARAIVEINGMVLIMSAGEVDLLDKKTERKTSRVDQAVYLLATEFPQYVLNELNDSYLKFYQSVLVKVDDIKKKLKTTST